MAKSRKKIIINKRKVINRLPAISKEMVIYKAPGSRKRKRGANARGVRVSDSASVRHYALGLTRPAIAGPFRQPRLEFDARTILAQKRTVFNIVGDAVVLVKGMHLANKYDGDAGRSFQANSETLALGTFASIPAGAQFPPAVSFSDMNIVAAAIKISYIGTAAAASGSLIMGTLPDPSDAALGNSSYSDLRFYPNFLEIPVSDLLNGPYECWMTKASPAADSFFLPAVAFFDLNLPCVIASGLAITQTIRVEITANYEGRPAFGTLANQMPFDDVAVSAKEVSSFAEAERQVSLSNRQVCQVMPHGWMQTAAQVAGGYITAKNAERVAQILTPIVHELFMNN